MIPHTNATAFPLYSPSPSSNSSLFLNVTQSPEGMMTTEGPAPTLPEGLGTQAFLNKLLARAGHPENKQHRQKRSLGTGKSDPTTQAPPLTTTQQPTTLQATTQTTEQATTAAQTTLQLSTESSSTCSTKECLEVCELITKPPPYSVGVFSSCPLPKNLTFSEECGAGSHNIPRMGGVTAISNLPKDGCWKGDEWKISDPTSTPLTTTTEKTTTTHKTPMPAPTECTPKKPSFLPWFWKSWNPLLGLGQMFVEAVKGKPPCE